MGHLSKVLSKRPGLKEVNEAIKAIQEKRSNKRKPLSDMKDKKKGDGIVTNA